MLADTAMVRNLTFGFLSMTILSSLRLPLDLFSIEIPGRQMKISVPFERNRTSEDATLRNQTKSADPKYTVNISAPFPRWQEGISVLGLKRAIDLSLMGRVMPNRVDKVYVVDTQSRLWKATPVHPSQSSVLNVSSRSQLMERFAAKTLRLYSNTTAYPYLQRVVQNGGFAYISNHADSLFCSDVPVFSDMNKVPLIGVGVPIFTLSSPLQCAHGFPVPNYASIRQAMRPWKKLIRLFEYKYAWEKKLRQAVWRGSLTGKNTVASNTRLRLCQAAERRPDMFDVRVSKKRHRQFLDDPNFDEQRYMGAKMPMEENQKYRAIIDVDGNSWSSRFGELLCYSSVILKVQPEHVDFFHPTLKPWFHYIPVAADLSDLYLRVDEAISDTHERQVKMIIANANRWCLENLSTHSLMREMASIWDNYAGHLYQADPHWGSTWSKQSMLSTHNFSLVD